MHAKVRDEGLTFAQEPAPPQAGLKPWKLLIVDDEEEVHRVTKLALIDFTHFGRPLEFLHAYSGREAVEKVSEHPDVALILMDVVMESEHAGLKAVLAIRNELRNRLTRIVIRTGQPGRAPEGLVVSHYDVNDYKEKTEVTARKLHTLVHSGLSLYRELTVLQGYKEGLEQVIGASAALQAQRSEESLARSALQQLAMMLYAEAPRLPSDMVLAVRLPGGGSRVLAGTGYYSGCAGRRIEEALGPALARQVDSALQEDMSAEARPFVARAAMSGGGELFAYIAGAEPPRPFNAEHVALFCRNVAAGFDNLRLQRELRQSQRSLVLLFATAIEQRVNSHGGHGQRVAACVRLFGELLGLPDEVLEWLPLAATLHDVGHIAVPEAILAKVGPRSLDEQALFETHTRWGQELLSSQDSEVLQMAGLIAAQHHERWDGQGYPARLAGNQIHLYGRIAALADALDEALRGPAPVSFDEALHQVQEDSGYRFDPALVELLVRHAERFRALGDD